MSLFLNVKAHEGVKIGEDCQVFPVNVLHKGAAQATWERGEAWNPHDWVVALAFDAPRDVPILRESAKRKSPKRVPIPPRLACLTLPYLPPELALEVASAIKKAEGNE